VPDGKIDAPGNKHKGYPNRQYAPGGILFQQSEQIGCGKKVWVYRACNNDKQKQNPAAQYQVKMAV
jgi:hypothetical protein